MYYRRTYTYAGFWLEAALRLGSISSSPASLSLLLSSMVSTSCRSRLTALPAFVSPRFRLSALLFKLMASGSGSGSGSWLRLLALAPNHNASFIVDLPPLPSVSYLGCDAKLHHVPACLARCFTSLHRPMTVFGVRDMAVQQDLSRQSIAPCAHSAPGTFGNAGPLACKLQARERVRLPLLL